MTLCSLNSVSAAQRKIRLRLCIIEPLFAHLKCRANLLLISSGKDSFHTRFLLGVPDSRKGSTWGSSLFHTRFLLGVPDPEIRSCVFAASLQNQNNTKPKPLLRFCVEPALQPPHRHRLHPNWTPINKKTVSNPLGFNAVPLGGEDWTPVEHSKIGLHIT